MKGASWAAGTISTAPDVEVCNSQQQAREKNEKKDRIPCHFQPVGVHRPSRTHARAKMRRHVDADLSLSQSYRYSSFYLSYKLHSPGTLVVELSESDPLIIIIRT